MMRLHALSLAVMLLACAAFAQDLVAVAPNAAKVEYEDARLRVVRLKIAPNEVLPMHDRPQRVVITLTPNDVTLTRPDGSTSTTRTPAGQIAWSGAGKRSVTNHATALENITVELKKAGAPAQAVSHSPQPGPAVLTDRFHHWLFENQYVRVYEVRIPPGATTEFHTHALDSVFVHFSGGVVSSQREGQDWTKPETVEANRAEYSADSKAPFTHRVRNDGTSDYHLVVVQLLR